jgi:hypothetical protein
MGVEAVKFGVLPGRILELYHTLLAFLDDMNLTQEEALAILKTLQGSFILARVRVNLAPFDDPSIGVLRFDCEAILESCDADGVTLTWSEGRMDVRFDRASFRVPDPEDTALVGIEILYESVKCVICMKGGSTFPSSVSRE